ncbi:MAG: deoxyguanosinetriphosphate triphosphohydrolase [Desulfurivibrionaceae bacterium]|nr:deoxyguanosinetriphosphate triphosphohydrolase [Desulfobulbales bacterium]MDT8334673.1 deoxyguanosinetriphosphate triphosphohydrolase [Desulfurivibrionaceae bacterium]
MNVREKLEKRERDAFSEFACLSALSKGRMRNEAECPFRPAFQHDRDRIVYSQAFRRLKHKTQVFLAPSGDHCRTRLTHTLEVSEIARTMARAMDLNEDLVEAISLGHDLGHTPFGHAGETVLNELVPGGFSHYRQSLRVVDVLENGGNGLNLTYEVRDGIAKHSKGYGEVIPADSHGLPETAEGCLVRYADIIAYLSHDLDDAIHSNIIREEDVPDECHRVMGLTHSRRIMTMVEGVISQTRPDSGSEVPHLKFSVDPRVGGAMQVLRHFLFHQVYRSPRVHNEYVKSRKILIDLFRYFLENPEIIDEEMSAGAAGSSPARRVCDFIASMSDRHAQNLYHRLFVPGT